MTDGLKLMSAILAGGSVQALMDVDASAMVDGPETSVLQYVLSHYRTYSVLPDIETVSAQTGITIPPAIEPVSYYVNKIRERAIYTHVQDGFNHLREAMRNRNFIRMETIVNSMRYSFRAGTRNEVVTPVELLPEVSRKFSEAQRKCGMSGIPTGWPYLDETTGGYQQGDLIVMVGRTSIGKTHIVLHSALAGWRAGFNVLFISNEIPLIQLTRSIYGLVTGTDPDAMRKGRVSKHGWDRVKDIVESYGHHWNRMKMYNGAFASTVDKIDALVDTHQPDIIVIDGIDLTKSKIRARNKNENVEQVVGEIAEAKLRWKRPVVASTQFNRMSGSKGQAGTLETISFSAAIEHNSSIVMAIRPGSAPRVETTRLIDVMKGRAGERGSFLINYTFTPVNVRQREEEVAYSDMNWDADEIH